MNYENVPDGTYIEVAGELLPVTPVWGYFVGLKTNTRAGMLAPFTGVWTAKDGEKFVDPVRWVADLSKAVKLGTSHEQVAIWDCLNAKEVWL